MGQIGAKAEQIVDKAKLIAIAGVIALFFGLAGAFLMAGAFAALLAMWLPWPAALAITGVGFLSITAIALWVGTRSPKMSDEDSGAEHDSMVDSALSSLTDLPLDAARKIISERPLAALAVFSGFGALIARRPEVAIRLVERLITRFT
jgi:hypothetical protein